jgi:hypothetical protein
MSHGLNGTIPTSLLCFCTAPRLHIYIGPAPKTLTQPPPPLLDYNHMPRANNLIASPFSCFFVNIRQARTK